MFASTPAVTDTQIQNLVLLFELNLVHKFGVGFPDPPCPTAGPKPDTGIARAGWIFKSPSDTSGRI
jgi:hypothetical protein